ncbi:hypothetical protein VNO80_16400 [Phaseolus coccineus]|uniref:Uncharacterized protein n=1 Tax=Phaseolus coccineus TaxID=3886 RepID=A0AAN9MME1_PHACN
MASWWCSSSSPTLPSPPPPLPAATLSLPNLAFEPSHSLLLPFFIPRAIVVDGVSVRHDQRLQPSLNAGPLEPHLSSIDARSAPPDLAPRVTIPPDPLTGPTREVSDDVAAIIQLFSDRPINAEVREVVLEMKAKKEEVKVKKELLGLVGTVVALNQRLESVREALRSGGRRWWWWW